MGAGFGVSVSKNVSEQNADADLVQRYGGKCDVSCNNSMSNINVDIIDSITGGNIDLSQICSANGTCLMNSAQSSVSDVMFKAGNSAMAKNAAQYLYAGGNVDVAYNKSLQNIQQNISQQVDQTCKTTTTNQMNNITIFAADSDIGGDIDIAQAGAANGNCQLSSQMNLSAYASGSVDNCALSGKKGSKSCGAGKGGKSILKILMYIGVFMVIIVIIGIVGKMIGGAKSPQVDSHLVGGQDLSAAMNGGGNQLPIGALPGAVPSPLQGYAPPNFGYSSSPAPIQGYAPPGDFSSPSLPSLIRIAPSLR